MTNETQQVVLVTGASSGLGQRIAETFAHRNVLVYGTSRSAKPDRKGIRMRQLDVTDAHSVQDCVAGILAESGHIDVLVNNAGSTISAPAEETPLDQAVALMQTNFFGSVRVTNAVLPQMRQRCSGKLIFMSSLAGLIGTPGQAFYTASKHAVEGYAETLRAELHQFNIAVTLVEPGFFRTAIHEKAHTVSGIRIENYNTMRSSLDAVFESSIERGGDPQIVADVVANIVEENNPRLRYRVGGDAKRVPWLKMLLPDAWFFAGMRRRFGI